MTLVIVNGESVASDSRKKMVQSAASLIGAQGLNATSFSDVLADSGAPRGSIYFHFPGGKRELAKDAIRLTSEQVMAHMTANAGSSANEVLQHFVALFQHVVEASDGAAGCAVAGVTIDVAASDDELLGDALGRAAPQRGPGTRTRDRRRHGRRRERRGGAHPLSSRGWTPPLGRRGVAVTAARRRVGAYAAVATTS